MILNAGVNRPIPEIQSEVIKLVREKIGPVAAFKIAVPVARLPKTRSGKILRATMQKVVDGEDFKMPATIDDPAIIDGDQSQLGRARRLSPTGQQNRVKIAGRVLKADFDLREPGLGQNVPIFLF